MPKRVVDTDKRRVPLNLRTTEDTRAKIEEAAKQSGRSLGQEIENRIEQSFLFDQILTTVSERTKAATLSLMADLCDGPENLSAGIRVAQILSFYDLPDDKVAAINAVIAALPHIMEKKPLPFGGSIKAITDAAMFDAAFSPILFDIEHGKIKEPTLPEGIEFEKPENLKFYKPVDPEGDLFRSVIAEAKATDAKDKADATDKKKPRTYKKKS